MDNFVVTETIIDEITRISGSNPNECYQCGKCSGGCPLTLAMDVSPSNIMRLLQLGTVKPVLASKGIWLCVGCETCSTRCPRNIALPKIIDCLKVLAMRYGYGNSNQAVFHRTFLKSVRSRGRVFEAGVAFNSTLSSGKLSRGHDLGIPMLLKGRLKLLPSRVKHKQQIRRIISLTLHARED